jgi:hypothetical protein
MRYEDFIGHLDDSECPADLGPYLEALWYDANGDWHKSHQIVQNINDSTAARIHAYLHRKEGDDWNSKYWHRQAGSDFPQDMSLEDEWDMLAHQLTQNN